MPIYGLAVVRISPMKQFRAVEAVEAPSPPPYFTPLLSDSTPPPKRRRQEEGDTWSLLRLFHLHTPRVCDPTTMLGKGSREPYLGHTLVRYGTPEHVHSALWLRMGELPGPAGSSFMLMLRLPLWELPPKPAAHWNGKGGARPFE